MEKSLKSAFFGDRELTRDFITSRTVSDVENFVKTMSKHNKVRDPGVVKDITKRYQEFYIDSLQRAFGLNDKSMKELHSEFNDVANNMLKTLKVNEGRDPEIFRNNKKYLETYPYLYFSVVPRQIIQSRLADKTVQENRMLRSELSSVSKMVGELVKKIADIEVSYGIPPIARSVFEAIPDPISAQYDKQFEKYRDDLDVYHKINTFLKDNDSLTHSNFLMKPLEQIQLFINNGVKFATREEMERLSEFIKHINTDMSGTEKNQKQSSSNLIDFVVPE